MHTIKLSILAVLLWAACASAQATPTPPYGNTSDCYYIWRQSTQTQACVTRLPTAAPTPTPTIAPPTPTATASPVAPTVSSCGASPSAVIGNDRYGIITTGSGLPLACTLTFSQPWSQAPTCQVTPSTALAVGVSTTTTTLNITLAVTLSGGKLYYTCALPGS